MLWNGVNGTLVVVVVLADDLLWVKVKAFGRVEILVFVNDGGATRGWDVEGKAGMERFITVTIYVVRNWRRSLRRRRGRAVVGNGILCSLGLLWSR